MTLRFRLTFWFFAVIVLANALLSVVTVVRASRLQLDEVQTRVRLDLDTARAMYDRRIDAIRARMERTAENHAFRTALDDILDTAFDATPDSDDRQRLDAIVRPVFEDNALDILLVLDADGTVVHRVRHPESHGDDLSENPLVARALRHHTPQTGTLLVPMWVLAREGEDLAYRAFFDVVPTPGARETPDTIRTDGMTIAAAVPLLDTAGRARGVLYGAELLNRRFDLVDAIRDSLFQGHTQNGHPIGAATLFQDDVRISTNVLDRRGHRAVGTRLDERIYETVFVRGETHAGQSYVVNDWYLTAYGPIHDPEGAIVGALYVGLLRSAFTRSQRAILGVFLPVMVLTTFASLVLLYLVTRHVLSPIERILDTTGQIVAGNLEARVGIRPPGDMGRLSEAIDAMAESVAKRERRLEQSARERIGQSEKLASIGRLAAGVAHEINNPLTGILTFSSLLREKPNLDVQDKQDLDVIIRETTRVRDIVRGLLDFARRSPFEKIPLDLGSVVHDTLHLVANQRQFQNLNLEKQLAPDLPLVLGDRNQIQQVLLNLCLNACESMEEGGKLTVATEGDADWVRIRVSDTGHGIPEEHLEHIFDPFFTTKPTGSGTGLGLSVSYGIVQKHGGTIQVESAEGIGTVFTVALPVARAEDPELDVAADGIEAPDDEEPTDIEINL